MGRIKCGNNVVVLSGDPLQLDDLTFRSDLIADGHFLRRVGNELIGEAISGGALPLKPFSWSANGIDTFDTIQDAINNAPMAPDGFVYIFVPPGEYTENLTASRPVRLYGFGRGSARILGTFTTNSQCVLGSVELRIVPEQENWVLINTTQSVTFVNCWFSVYAPDYSGTVAYTTSYLYFDHCGFTITGPGTVFKGIGQSSRFALLFANVYADGTLFDAQSGKFYIYNSSLIGSVFGEFGEIYLYASQTYPPAPALTNVHWQMPVSPGVEYQVPMYFGQSVGWTFSSIHRVFHFEIQGPLEAGMQTLPKKILMPTVQAITKVHCSLGTPGTGSTLVYVVINGNEVVDIEIPSGETEAEVEIAEFIYEDYFIGIRVSYAGDGASDLSVAILLE